MEKTPPSPVAPKVVTETPVVKTEVGEAPKVKKMIKVVKKKPVELTEEWSFYDKNELAVSLNNCYQNKLK